MPEHQEQSNREKRQKRFQRFRKAVAGMFLSLTLFTGGVAGVTVAGIAAPQPAHAVFGVGDIVGVAQDVTAEVQWRLVLFRWTIERAAKIGIKNALRAMLNKLAYDTAEWIAAGDKNQESLAFNQTAGDYFKSVGGAAAGEFLNTIALENGLISINLCDLPSLDALQINLLLPQILADEPADCSLNDIAKEWKSFKKSETFAVLQNDITALVQINASLGPKSNAVSTMLLALDKAAGAELNAKEEAQVERLKSDFRDVTGIGGVITTPAFIAEAQLSTAIQNSSAAEFVITNDITADAIGVFTTTLASRLLTRFTTGFLAYLTNPSIDGSLAGDSSTTLSSASSIEDAEQRFAEFRTASFVTNSEVSILTEFAACPEEVVGTTNCVINEQWRLAIEEGLTLQEAVEQDIIDADTPLVKTSAGQEITNPNEGLSLRSLKVLAQYSVIPQLWVSAGEYIRDFSGTNQTIATLMDAYDNCGERNYSPYCGLVDPAWVLKAPSVLCRLQGYGEVLAADEYLDTDGSIYTPNERLVNRVSTCLDPQSCLRENDNGFCEAYGYCTEQERIYRFQGDSCPAYYASCESFENDDYSRISLLTNTVNYNDCDEDSVGCQWRCSVYNAEQGEFQCSEQGEIYETCTEGSDSYSEDSGTCECTSDTTSETCEITENGFSCEIEGENNCTLGTQEAGYYGEYSLVLDDDAEGCRSDDYGCNEFIQVKQEGENLLFNGDFETIDASTDPITDFTDTTGTTYGSAEYLFAFSSTEETGCVKGSAAGDCNGWEKRGIGSIPARVRAVENSLYEGSTAIQIEEQGTGSFSSTGFITHDFDTGEPLADRSFVFSFHYFDPSSSGACTARYWIGSDDGSSRAITTLSNAIGDGEAYDISYLASVDGSSFQQEVSETFTFPATTTDTVINVGITQPSGCDIVIDAAKLEENTNFTSYSAYLDDPLYLNINTAESCSVDEIGCELYTPQTGESELGIPGIITNPLEDACTGADGYTDPSCSQCIEEFVGCDAYIETPQEFRAPLKSLAYFDDPTAVDAGLQAAIEERTGYYCSETLEACDPSLGSSACGTSAGDCLPSVSIIPETAESCRADNVGCEAYVNIDESTQGAEAIQHYSFIRQCVKPTADQADNDETDTYFTWEGDDIDGYVLRSWDLKKSNYDEGPCQNLDLYDWNSDTVQTSEAECIDDELISAGTIGDIDCSSDYGDDPDCLEFNNAEGEGPFYRYKSETILVTESCVGLRNQEDNRIYYASLEESVSCPAAQNLCREYKGSEGGNVRYILESDFENGVWEVEDTTTGGYAAGTSISIGGGSMAIGSGTASLGGSGSTTAYSELDDTLEETSSYVVTFWAKGDSGSLLYPYFEYNERLYFDDDGVEMSDDWNKYTVGPFSFAEGEYTGGEVFGFEYDGSIVYIDNVELQRSNSHYLIHGTADFCNGYEGCEEYEDTAEETHYLKSFSNLCAESVVGCEALINTRNSDTPFYTEYNDSNEFIADNVHLAADAVETWVVDDGDLCSAGAAGCWYYGTPDLDAYGAVESYSGELLLNDPDNYDTILCEHQQMSCEAFTTADGSETQYFKDPGDRYCEYDSDQGIWVTSTGEECPLQNVSDSPSQPAGPVCNGGGREGLFCSTDDDCPATDGTADDSYRCVSDASDDSGWAGVCTPSYSGCTLYLDTNTVAENDNAGFETDVEDNDNPTSDVPDNIPDEWEIPNEGERGSGTGTTRTAFTIDGTERVAAGDIHVGAGFTAGILDEEDLIAATFEPSYTVDSGSSSSVSEDTSAHPSAASPAVFFIENDGETVNSGLSFEFDGFTRYRVPGFAPEGLGESAGQYIAFYMDTDGNWYWADSGNNGLEADLSDALTAEQAITPSHALDQVTVGNGLSYIDVNDVDFDIDSEESAVFVFAGWDFSDFNSDSPAASFGFNTSSGATKDNDNGNESNDFPLLLGSVPVDVLSLPAYWSGGGRFGTSNIGTASWNGLDSESLEITLYTEEADGSESVTTTYFGPTDDDVNILYQLDECGNLYWGDDGMNGVNSTGSDVVGNHLVGISNQRLAVIVDSSCESANDTGDTDVEVNGYYDSLLTSAEISCEEFAEDQGTVAKDGQSLTVDAGSDDLCMVATDDLLEVDPNKNYSLRGLVYSDSADTEYSIGLLYYNNLAEQIRTVDGDPEDYAIAAYEGGDRSDNEWSTTDSPATVGAWARFHGTIGPNRKRSFPAGTAYVRPFVETTGGGSVRFDEVEFSENGAYTYIADTVDGSDGSSVNTCEGSVDIDNGCVAFYDTTVDVTELSLISDIADAQAANDNIFPVTCTVDSDDETQSCDSYANGADSNTVLRVRNDRECAEWLACGTAAVDLDDATGEITNVTCGEIVRCRELHPDTGECVDVVDRPSDDGLGIADDITVTSQPGNVLELMSAQNVAGYAKAGVEWVGSCVNSRCVGGANSGQTCSSNSTCEESQITYGYYPYDWMPERGTGAADSTTDIIFDGDFEDVYCNGDAVETEVARNITGSRFNPVRDRTLSCTYDYQCRTVATDNRFMTLWQASWQEELGDESVDVIETYGEDYASEIPYHEGWCNNVDESGNWGRRWSTTADGNASMHIMDYDPDVVFRTATDFVDATGGSGYLFGSESNAAGYAAGYTDFNNVMFVQPDNEEATGIQVLTATGEIIPDEEYTVSFDAQYLDTPDEASDFIEVGLMHGSETATDIDYFATGESLLDVVFLVEATGDMSTAINTAAGQLDEFHDVLSETGINPAYHIGFVGSEYRSQGGSFEPYPLDFGDYTTVGTWGMEDSDFETGYVEDPLAAGFALAAIAANPFSSAQDINMQYELLDAAFGRFPINFTFDYRSGAERVYIMLTDSFPEGDTFVQAGDNIISYDPQDEPEFVSYLQSEGYEGGRIYGLIEDSEKVNDVGTSYAPSTAYDGLVDHYGGRLFDVSTVTVESAISSIADDLAATYGGFQFNTGYQRYTLGPLTIEEKSDAGDSSYLFIRQSEGSNNIPFVIDNVSLKPALEVNAEASTSYDGRPWLISRRCRGYAGQDSETCSGSDSGIVFTGWQGYCLVEDEWNSDQCISWWPVDTISSESNILSQSKTAVNYGGPAPAFHCLVAKGNANVGACSSSSTNAGYICNSDSDCDGGTCLGNSTASGGNNLTTSLYEVSLGIGSCNNGVSGACTTNSACSKCSNPTGAGRCVADSSIACTGSGPFGTDTRCDGLSQCEYSPTSTSRQTVTHNYSSGNYTMKHNINHIDIDEDTSHVDSKASARWDEWAVFASFKDLPVEQTIHISEIDNIQFNMGDVSFAGLDSNGSAAERTGASKAWEFGPSNFHTRNLEVDDNGRGFFDAFSSGYGSSYPDASNKKFTSAYDECSAVVYAGQMGAWCDPEYDGSGHAAGICDPDTFNEEDLEEIDFYWVKGVTNEEEAENIVNANRVRGGGDPMNPFFEWSVLKPDSVRDRNLYPVWAEADARYPGRDNSDGSYFMHDGTSGLWEYYWYGRGSINEDATSDTQCWNEHTVGANIVAVNFDFVGGYLDGVYLIYWDGFRRYDASRIRDIFWRFQLKEPCLLAVEGADADGDVVPWHKRLSSDSDYQLPELGYTRNMIFGNLRGNQQIQSWYGGIETSETELDQVDGEESDVVGVNAIEFQAVSLLHNNLPGVYVDYTRALDNTGLPFTCIGSCNASACQGTYDSTDIYSEGATCDSDKLIGVPGICYSGGSVETDSQGRAIICDSNEVCTGTCQEVDGLNNEAANGEAYLDQLDDALTTAWAKYKLLFPAGPSRLYYAAGNNLSASYTNPYLTELTEGSGFWRTKNLDNLFNDFNTMNTCPASGRPITGTLASQYCAIRPSIDNVRVNNTDTGDIVLQNGQTATLLFNSDVDEEQIPLNSIRIEWEPAEGEEFDVSDCNNGRMYCDAYEAAPKNNHYYTHIYTCDPTDDDDNYGEVTTSDGRTFNACVFDLRIQLEDNWAFCSGDENNDEYGDRRGTPYSGTTCSTFDTYGGRIIVQPDT